MDHAVTGPRIKSPIPDATLWEFDWACVDQEVIVSYDPKFLTDQPGGKRSKPGQAGEKPKDDGVLPKLDFSDDPYYFRQATPLTMYEKLKRLGHASEAAKMAKPASVIYGHAMTHETDHSEITVRAASPAEVKSLNTSFSYCTVPLIFQTIWCHNLNEWFTRAPVTFKGLQQDLSPSALPRDLTIVPYSPNKIPVPHFNLVGLQPFSTRAVIPFADFSARLPPSTPSASTAEGYHTRCFRGGGGGARHAAGAEGRDVTVECIAHEFGAHPMGFIHDMWVMTQVDVFVTFHGAGQMNAIFMPPQSSMIEVRGINASFALADHWHPQISRSSNFRYFWWGLMVQDPAYVGKSGLDAAGFYSDAERGNWKSFMFRKRDQNVRLAWPHLAFMLRRIVSLDKNTTAFRKRFGSHFAYYGTPSHAGVVYEVQPGSEMPVRHPGPKGRADGKR